MRKIKYWLVLLALITPVIILSGCESVTQRADTQDTWNLSLIHI